MQLFDFSSPSGDKDQRGISRWSKSLDLLREFDLILISNEKIDTEANNFWCNSDFLLSMRAMNGKFLGMVKNSRKSENNYVTIKVDAGLDAYFFENQKIFHDPYTNLYCYSVGSLLTSVREFKTIKNCEFFNTGPTILNPKQGLNDVNLSNT